jgi:hypothetical protein
VSDEKFLYQGLQFGMSRGYGKYFFFFGGKVERDFLFKDLLNLCLPRLHIDLSGLNGTVQAYTQRQAMLVLVGQRNEVFVAKHGYLFSSFILCLFSSGSGQSATGAAPAQVTLVTIPSQLLMLETQESIQTLAVTACAASFTAGLRVSQSVRTLSHS